MIFARSLAATIRTGTVAAFAARRSIGALTRRFAVACPIPPRLRRVRTGGTTVTRRITVAATFRVPRRMTVAIARTAAMTVTFAVTTTALTARCTRAITTLG